MKTVANVINVWAFRSGLPGSRFLLFRTSQLESYRYFNGGRFWQIPSGCVGDDEAMENAVQRILGAHGLTAITIRAGEHVYIIYNRRFAQLQMIAVFAAEVQEGPVRLDADEHSEFGCFSLDECLERIHYKGLKEGFASVHEYVTGTKSAAREPCLYQRGT